MAKKVIIQPDSIKITPFKKARPDRTTAQRTKKGQKDK